MYKILIRPLAIEDANISWKWRNDAEVWAQTGNRPDKPITLDIEIEWIKRSIKDKTTKRFAITVDDQYVGNVQLTDITDSVAQFHIFIGEKSFWGKGVANQATYQILNYAKEILKLTEVYLYVRKSNLSAIKVYEKNSFVKEEQFVEEIKMSCRLIDLVTPMVSIFCMVYNHEPYIRECLEGFLMQVCNFNYQIVIGEDCSTDNSRAIILEYAQKNPGKFKLLLHEKNIGAVKNQTMVFENCVGKYIALCEGDDYWTDPLKLQKQVDFLEENPAFNFSFHDCEILNETTGQRRLRVHHRNIDEIVDLKSVIIQNNIATASLVFKNMDWSALPNWFQQIKKGDYGLIVILAEKGKGQYFSDVMSVYRVHGGGVWSSQSNEYVYQQDLLFYGYLLAYFKEKQIKKAIQQKINFVEANQGLALLRQGFLLKGLFQVLFYNNWFGDKRVSLSIRKILSGMKSNFIKKGFLK